MTKFKFNYLLLLLYLIYSGGYPVLQLAEAASNDSSIMPVPPHSYRLVTVPTSKKEDAEVSLEKVRTEVPRAEIIEVHGKKVYYRLVAGRFNDMSSALRFQSDLTKRNISSYILQSKSRYRVIVSSHISEQYALEEQKQLADKHIRASIVKYYQPTPNWQITSVDMFELRDAVYTASIMSTKDVITTIE